MELKLHCMPNGSVISPTLIALASRDIRTDVSKEESSIQQAMQSHWRRFNDSLNNAVCSIKEHGDESDDDTSYIKPIRDIFYDGTELFDVYCKYIPSKLNGIIKKPNRSGFEKNSKKYRSRSSEICNLLKHKPFQISSILMQDKNGTFCQRCMITKSVDGASILRADEIHKGVLGGICSAQIIKETLFGIFYVDLLAAEMINHLPNKIPHEKIDFNANIISSRNLVRSVSQLKTHSLHDGPVENEDFLVEELSISLKMLPSVRFDRTVNYQTTHFPFGRCDKFASI